MDLVYLDHGATTPVRPEVVQAMLPFLKELFGNPSSAYRLGQESRRAVEAARRQVAALLNAGSPDEIVFTSCGSESDSLAIQGAAQRAFETSKGRRRHVITSKIEHDAVLDSVEVLKARGFEVTLLGADGAGRVDPKELAAALRPETAVVSVMHSNNEVGTLEPVAELAKLCREKGVLFHTDAVQSAGKVPLDVRELGVDLLSISGHKINAPKGVGALYIRRGVELAPLVTGTHERGRRGGTENVASIVGLGRACELAAKEMKDHAVELTRLRRKLEQGILALKDVRLNGPADGRLPGTAHFSFKDLEGSALVVALDQEGLCVSAGSACSTGAVDPSHVLAAMGVAPEWALGSLRVSMGWGSTEKDVDRLLAVLPKAVEKMRAAHKALSA